MREGGSQVRCQAAAVAAGQGLQAVTHTGTPCRSQSMGEGVCLCRSSGMRGGEVRVGSVCQPSARNSGWIESLGILLCTNREYIYFFPPLPLSSVGQKSKAGNPTVTSVASLCWQRCNMSDINVRRSRCEGAQRQSDLVFTPSRAPSPALAGHGRYTKGVTQPRLLDSQKPV